MSQPQPQPKTATAYLTPGPNAQENPPRPPPLEAQLPPIPKDISTLIIVDETPSDKEWSLLSTHFTSVKDLTLDSGYNEYLNDNIPLHWPLERLVLNSAAGEPVRTPWIKDGLVKHLRFELTMGLRFEGPSNEELVKMQKERIARGEEEEYKTESGITITYLPQLVQRWLGEKYAIAPGEEKKAEEQGQHEIKAVPNLETLEIIENDVHDVLVRLSLSIPRIFSNVKTLRLRATNACDLHYAEDVLHQLLPQLAGLKTLDLTLGIEYVDPKHLTELYRHFPPNLETLQFRSAAQLAKSNNWPEWVTAFQNPEFLPQLRTLSFLLDLNLEEGFDLSCTRKQQKENQENETEDKSSGSSESEAVESSSAQRINQNGEPTDKKYKVSTEDLRIAKRACEQIWEAAEQRGIGVEPFSEEFPESFPCQKPFDERWEGLSL